jgi:CelD/BcsL family acetyltransferase involved in cellulose biosynthesis
MMVAAGASEEAIARLGDETPSALTASASDLPLSSGALTVSVTNRIEDVEAIWRALTAERIESPGQSYDFIRLWIADRQIDEDDQRYVVARLDGAPIALLPLRRRRRNGLFIYTWFPSSHVGCYAPISDYTALERLGADGRRALWQEMIGKLDGADAVYLRSIPTEIAGYTGLFDELGEALTVETLYRAEFTSWEQCDQVQRSRTRRKHDRQQGDRLVALGDIGFELVTDPLAGTEAIGVMFRQRSARFRAQGIRDIFVCDNLVGFYLRAMQPGSGVDVRLHVLRLNGEIVAVRYNIVHGDRMFCLISSMSDDPQIQIGSPGKQCLLRVMQSVFDAGFTMFDMGSGFTDEKRHWCNVQTPLRPHYVGITRKGQAAVGLHRNFQRLRAWAKAHPTIKNGLRHVRQIADRLVPNRPASE